MLRIDHIRKDWKEAGSFPTQINLYGFWDEHCFLTKSGDLGAVLEIGGIDYESLDHRGRDYAVKRAEAAFRSLDDKTRLYQILFRRNTHWCGPQSSNAPNFSSRSLTDSIPSKSIGWS
jgi:type IV secretory pathway VirB4 component